MITAKYKLLPRKTKQLKTFTPINEKYLKRQAQKSPACCHNRGL